MARYSYQKRAFLAPPSTNHTSFVVAEVESTFEGEYVNGTNLLIIADCYRHITLEFALSNARARRQSLAKINRLIKILCGFRSALKREIRRIEKRH